MAQLTEVAFRIRIPEDLAAQYEQQAQAAGMDAEEFIAKRLKACANHDAVRPLFFDDDQRRDFEAILQGNYRNAKEALKALRAAMSVRVQSVPVTLTPQCLERLKSRHQDSTSWPDFVAATFTRMAEEYVGLR